ncbi:hypothetical protein [Bacillus sp. m3-13]|uniref:hypothetical protein n=1 Tax=Bacillus sp. m3-13 TaxID=406124 RepID=UPI0001E89D44|nr:hypothetical protein [Bacillus sp. m3-13]
MSDKKKKTAINVGLAGAASEVVNRFGSANAQHIKAYTGYQIKSGIYVKGLRDIAGSKNNSYANAKQQAGFAGEVILESKTNAENIIQQKTERVSRTDSLGKKNHQEFDHVKTDANGNPILDKNGNYTGTSQMKLRGEYDLEEYIKRRKLKDPNWEPPKDLTQQKLIEISSIKNVKKLVNGEFEKFKNANNLDIPTEQYEPARKYLQEQQKELKKQITHLKENGDNSKVVQKQEELNRVRSVEKRLRKSVSSKEAMNARMDSLKYTVKEVHKVSHQAGMQQAKIGAILGGAISLSRQIVMVAKGEETNLKDATVNVLKDTGQAAALSYATGYSGAAIKALMERSGKVIFQNLSKSNMPAMIATATLETTKSIRRYLNEEDFDELQLLEELGEKGTGMLAGSIGAALATAVLPVVAAGTAGAVVVSGLVMVGGMVGYMTGSAIYASAMDLLQEQRLAAEKRILVEQLAKDAIAVMEKERQELQGLIHEHLAERQTTFEVCFEGINEAIISGDHSVFKENLNNIAITFGTTLQFLDFEEFDDFMQDDTMTFKF